MASGWTVATGEAITASMVDQPNRAGYPLGARVEVPVSREVVSYYKLATMSSGPAESGGGIWTVTLDGVLNPGFYDFVWRTNDAEPPSFEAWIPIEISGASTGNGSGSGGSGDNPWPDIDTTAVRPTVADVSALERTRMSNAGGHDTGVFNADTRPTADEVDTLIEQALDDTLNLLPYSVDPRHYEHISRAIALYAASLVEASYFREQFDEGSVRLYRDMFEAAISSLTTRIDTDYREAQLANSNVGSGLPEGAILT